MEIFKIHSSTMSPCAYEDIEAGTEDHFFLVLSKDEFAVRSHSFGFPEHPVAETINPRQYPVFESYPELIFISTNELGWHPKRADWLVARELNFFLKKNILVAVHHNHSLEVPDMSAYMNDVSLSRILHFYLDRIVEADRRIIAEIEKRITDLEDEIITFSGSLNNEVRANDEVGKVDRLNKKVKPKRGPRKTKVYKSHMEEIILHRKRILFLKKYIEPLDDIIEEMLENDNGVIPVQHLGLFKRLSFRADRNVRNLNSLRDYVTQVREAWQAQVDIGLNDIMRVFTVITAIFLPLTLIAGWYGMNFENMPELSWKYGYPLAYLLSFIVVAFSLWYFRKNKFI